MKKLFYTLAIIIGICIIVVPLLFIFVLNNGNPYTKYIVEKHVPNHLEQQGYTEKDLHEQIYVEPKEKGQDGFYQGQYKVVFKDEPNITYYYGVEKEGKQVKQFCEKETVQNDATKYITTTTKHSEDNCTK